MEVQDEVQAGQDMIYLSPSVRAKIMEICAQEGATLNKFVSVAIADKLEQYEEMQWMKRRKVPTEESLLNARRILRRAGDNPPDPGDELPEGYVLPELP